MFFSYLKKVNFYSFFQSKLGQGVVEYTLVIAFVVIVAAGLLSGTNPVSKQVANVFTNLGDTVTEAESK